MDPVPKVRTEIGGTNKLNYSIPTACDQYPVTDHKSFPVDRGQNFEQMLLFQKHRRFGIGRSGKVDSASIIIESAFGFTFSVTELDTVIYDQPLLFFIDGAMEFDNALIFLFNVRDEHFVANAEFGCFALFRRLFAEFHGTAS